MEQQELVVNPPDEVALGDGSVAAAPQVEEVSEERVSPPASSPKGNGAAAPNPRVEAGRKGGHRVHELIREGRLYEKEHGLKRGRQRLRQLIELGKAYEVEHGLRPAKKKRNERLSRMGREELLGTFLRCLVRIARPSFRAELVRLVEALSRDEGVHAAP
jgi:hypothetical protein